MVRSYCNIRMTLKIVQINVLDITFLWSPAKSRGKKESATRCSEDYKVLAPGQGSLARISVHFLPGPTINFVRVVIIRNSHRTSFVTVPGWHLKKCAVHVVAAALAWSRGRADRSLYAIISRTRGEEWLWNIVFKPLKSSFFYLMLIIYIKTY